MRKYDIVHVKEVQLIEWSCSICGLDFTRNELEAQEAFSFTQNCGHGSVFGDGNKIYIDLCQHCMKEKLGEFITCNNDDY